MPQTGYIRGSQDCALADERIVRAYPLSARR